MSAIVRTLTAAILVAAAVSERHFVREVIVASVAKVVGAGTHYLF